MGFTDTIEVWVVTIGVLLVCMGGTAVVIKKVAPTDKVPWLAERYKWFIGIGILLIFLAMGIALFMHRLGGFASSLMSPGDLIREILLTGTTTYSQVCVEGECAKYCCQDKLYPELKWKDCSASCDGWEGHFGDMMGDNCQGDLNLDAYCKRSATVDTNYRSSACNFDPAKGPVTCTCCTGRNATGFDTYWWDCNASCSSYGLVGSSVGAASCASKNKLYCIKTETDSELVEQTNNQSF